MTRETKIGLLIGLGFIVVFAVLLSHTGTPVPTGDGLAMAPRNAPGTSPAGARPLSNSTYVPAGRSSGIDALGSTATRPSSGRVGLGDAPSTPRNPRGSRDAAGLDGKLAQLPEPKSLMHPAPSGGAVAMDKPATSWERILASAKSTNGSSGTGSTTAVPPSNLSSQRVAPPRHELVTAMQPPHVEPPQPSVRPESPTVTANSQDKTVALAANDASKTPPARQEAPKEYVVQKGDTLRQIVKDTYGTGSTKVVEFVVASNKNEIKDKNMIIEGQKLALPPLPPEMFESAPNFDVSGMGVGVRTVSNEDLSRVLGVKRERTAPPLASHGAISLAPATQPAADKLVRADRNTSSSDKNSKAPAGYHMIEIRANETLRSIAGRELGSANSWEEIQKLNPNLNPRKLMPGTKIKVPTRKPMTSASGSRRESA